MFTTRPELRGTFGAVASTHWLASAVGMSMLERGGTAFDAAVATAFVLQVVEPHLNGPAGEAPILLASRKSGRVEVICGQGVAPAAATIERYHELGFDDLVPGTGLLATVVPGAFDAWMLLLRDYGTMRPAEILAPAIAYAVNGYPLVPQIATTIATVQDLFLTEWKSSAAVYLPGGALPLPGLLFRNKQLGATYQRISDEAVSAGGDRDAQIEAARRAWSRGFVADTIDRFCRSKEVMDVSGRRHRGLLTGDDMARWRATIEAPATYDYHGYTVAKTGPWGQGPVLLQQLALLRDIDVAGMDPLGGEFVHTVVEAAKLAFADREAWYGDPDFVDVPLAALLSASYAAERGTLIGETASYALRPGAPDGRQPRLPDLSAVHAAGGAGIGEPTMRRDGEPVVTARGETRGDTCHLDIVDRWGNMVSATPSGGWLMSSPVIPKLGFALNSRAQMFWLQDGLPASLAPGTRPRSTLSPSFALKDGEPYMAFGTPGGDQQDQWSAQLFLRHVHHGMNLQEAIDVPAFHTEHMPNSFYPRAARPGHLAVEGRMPPATIAELRRRGHDLEIGEDWSEGRLSACAIERTPEGNIVKAAANPRGMQGYAIAR
jgi:gamma-glutamyltranspeptidase/glutathione hydrolase